MPTDFYGMSVESNDGGVHKLYRGKRLIAVVRRHQDGSCTKVWGEMNDLTLVLFQKHVNRMAGQ